MIEFRIGGRSVTPANVGDALKAALLQAVEDDLRAKIGSIRDPETGEFPLVVVKGRDIENLSISVEGSSRVVDLVKARLGLDDKPTEEGDPGMEQDAKLVAFLCHATEDKDLVRRLAGDLLARGIDVFFDEWEIRAGDSLRQRIDAGLQNCTHFIAVLSPTSIGKPWVNSEMDAGFVMRLQQQVAFIPIRLGLDVTALPPLLRGVASPTIDNYDVDVAKLVSDIHGLSRKPPIGPRPTTKATATPGSEVSPAAEAIMKLLVERSQHGDMHDPSIDADELRKATGLSDDDIVDAVDELSGQGYVGKRIHMGCDVIGFAEIYPEGELFAKFDASYMTWDPAADALVLATKLMEATGNWLRVAEAAASLAWPPRRMNPALHFLMNRRLADYSEATGSHPWATHSIEGTAATRRFARSRQA